MAFFIPSFLREHASEFDLTRMSRLAVGFAFASDRFFFHHGHPGAVHLQIQNGNGLADDYRQIQLYGALNLLVFAFGDMLADDFGRTFHGLGGDVQSGQKLHLLEAMIKRPIRPH
jgi:hypothetical protein